MIGRTNAGGGGGGKKSLILPTNPDLSIQSDDSKLVLSWTQPTTEVEVDHYNIYTSLTEPASLNDMELVGSVHQGKNLLDTSEMYADDTYSKKITSPYTTYGVTYSRNLNGSIHMSGSSTTNATIYIKTPTLGYGRYVLSGGVNADAFVSIKYTKNDGTTGYDYDYGGGIKIDLGGTCKSIEYITIKSSSRNVNVDVDINLQLERGTKKTSYEPYTDLTYELTNLTNDQTYYVGIQAVSVEGYENASMWKVENGIPHQLRFVCVGYSGSSYYSTNGTTWVAMSGLDTSNGYRGVTYGKDRFVCVGQSGSSYYSTDGTTWIAMNGLDTSTYYLGITYGKDRFVCVGTKASSYYSIDGINWVAMSGSGGNGYSGVTYGNNRFVCVGGDYGKSYYSTDGTTWTAMSGLNTSYSYEGVTYGKDRFVCVGGNNGINYYSTDGINWIAMSGSGSNVYRSVTYGNNRFVCVGNSGSSYYSTDGTSWVAMSGLDTSKIYYGVTYGKDRFVCVGNSGLSYYSTDGTSWIAMSGLDTSIQYNAVCSNTTE